MQFYKAISDGNTENFSLCIIYIYFKLPQRSGEYLVTFHDMSTFDFVYL